MPARRASRERRRATWAPIGAPRGWCAGVRHRRLPVVRPFGFFEVSRNLREVDRAVAESPVPAPSQGISRSMFAGADVVNVLSAKQFWSSASPGTIAEIGEAGA